MFWYKPISLQPAFGSPITNSGIFHLFAYLEIKKYIEREKAGHVKKRYSEEIDQASEQTSAITWRKT